MSHQARIARSLIAALLVVLPSALLAATPLWSLGSPDGHLVISVSLATGGRLQYAVHLDEKPVILDSPLGLRREDAEFDHALQFVDANVPQERHEKYELFAGGASHVDHALRFRTLTFRNPAGAQVAIDLAATGEGVAFRYRFPETNQTVRVLQAELTGFNVSPAARGWLQPYHSAGDYTPAYEDFFFHVAPGQPPPNSRAQPIGWCFPALFEIPESVAWVLITESGTDASYCGCHLAPESPGGNYRIAFPAANEATRRQTNSIGPEPRWALPWTMPWRVLVVGKSAGAISQATLVTDLAPPSRVKDVSWIRPGRASWAWWAYPDGPVTTNLFNRYTDFAAEMGWEYTLFDAGWWKPGLAPIARHAQQRNVAPLAWMFAGDFYKAAQRKAKLDEVQAAGVLGVKVDFWCSDRQEAIAAIQALFEDAASRHLVVNLHGCTLPRGWERTWPNFLTAEAVLGTESYFYESHYTEKAPELNTVLPFTRNAVGPMDSTPVACTPKKYRRTTTAAHELATAIILKSGLVHFADKPEFFRSLPTEALQVFRDAPARWDETRCLQGEPGRSAIFARRAGNSWFIAGLNGTSTPLAVDLDLSAFAGFGKRLAITEGIDPAMQVVANALPVGSHWTHQVPPAGGFILRFDK